MTFIVQPSGAYAQGYCYFPLPIDPTCKTVCRSNCSRVCSVDCIALIPGV